MGDHHGHSHGGGCGDEHSHDDDAELGIQYSLFEKVDLDKVVCLNEETEGSGKTVFKPWDQRMSKEAFVSSDADEELLFNIPFTGNVKLKGIRVIGGEGGSHPNKMRLFKNLPQMDFDDTGGKAEQEFNVIRDEIGAVEYEVRTAKFSAISDLSIHFPSNFGADSTKIYYIGLRGEWSPAGRREAVVAVYEARAVPQDHKGEIPEAARHGMY